MLVAGPVSGNFVHPRDCNDSLAARSPNKHDGKFADFSDPVLFDHQKRSCTMWSTMARACTLAIMIKDLCIAGKLGLTPGKYFSEAIITPSTSTAYLSGTTGGVNATDIVGQTKTVRILSPLPAFPQ